MRKLFRSIIIIASLAVYMVGLNAPMAFAATNSTTPSGTATNGQALEIAPPVIYLNADPGQSVKAQIFIRDISNGNLIVNGQVNDFVASGTDGTPKILLNDKDGTSAFSLKPWVAALPSLLLVPREIKTMTATINVPKNASPGGHYGVIRFTSTAPSLDGSTSGVSLAASIGVLVLLTVSGNVKESLSIAQFSAAKNNKAGSFFESSPLSFIEKFNNTGNVHVQPTGKVVVTDMFGKTLATLGVNVPPANVLPTSSRQFNEALDKTVIGTKHLFGRYTAKLSVTYGSDKKTLTATTSFWVIPYKVILIVIIALIILFFVLRFMIRRYNRRVLAQAQKRQQK